MTGVPRNIKCCTVLSQPRLNQAIQVCFTTEQGLQYSQELIFENNPLLLTSDFTLVVHFVWLAGSFEALANPAQIEPPASDEQSWWWFQHCIAREALSDEACPTFAGAPHTQAITARAGTYMYCWK